MEFATAALHRIIKEQGDKRVSEEAAEYLGEYLENSTLQIAEKALENAERAGSASIQPTHIRSALRE